MSFEPSPAQKCQFCNDKEAIYKCPKCLLRTCSATCSTGHKERDKCSGIRNKAAYVPMNQYTWGTMVDDYTFLEEMGRKADEWGREIVKGGYTASLNQGRGRGRGRGRGARGAHNSSDRSFKKHSKRDAMKVQLEAQDIFVELLPSGMQRRLQNQSVWNPKTKTLHLTLEFNFHDPLHNPQSLTQPFCLLTHRNDIETPLIDVLRYHLRDSKTSKVPAWVKDLVGSPDEDEEPPLCLMKQHSDSHSLETRLIYVKFNPLQKLSLLLKNRTFVEFPTIEVWREGQFTGTTVDAESGEKTDAAPPRKRRKLDPKESQKTLQGLLGDYGSDEEENDVLELLGDYDSNGDSSKMDITTQDNYEESSDDDHSTDELGDPLDNADFDEEEGPEHDAPLQNDSDGDNELLSEGEETINEVAAKLVEQRKRQRENGVP